MIDSGNTVTEATAITAELHQKLGAAIATADNKPVNTALPGAQLQRIGQSTPISLEIEGTGIQTEIRPVVVNELSDPLNLGSGFLHELSVSQNLPIILKYEGRRAFLEMGQKTVEMIRILEDPTLDQATTDPERPVVQPRMLEHTSSQPTSSVPPTQETRATSPDNTLDVSPKRSRNRTRTIPQRRDPSPPRRKKNIFAAETITLKKNTLNFVPIHYAEPTKGFCTLIEPLRAFTGEVIPAVYRHAQEKQNKVAIMNMSNQHITIQRGSPVGYYSNLRHTSTKDSDSTITSTRDSEEGNADRVVRELKLDESPLLRDNPKMKQQVEAVIRQYHEVFGEPGRSIGKTNLLEFDIQLAPDAVPCKSRLRPLNPAQRASLEEQIKIWRDEDIIEESTSPWASALVPAFKKGGSIRWAVDYRGLNKVTIADAYPLPSIEENLERLQGSTIYSTLDAAAAYHTIAVKEKVRPYLAFITPSGLFHFKRMPFGCKNSGSTYARFVELSIMKLRRNDVLAYIDDIIIHSGDLKTHLEALRDVLQLHKDAGIKLRPHKTKLFARQADYLGYKITAEGVAMQDEYIRKVLEWPTPQNPKQLATWIGFIGYYRSFIPNFSALTNQMNAQKKEKELNWTSEMQENFETLKEEFGRKPVRAYPRYDLDSPFLVATDYSAQNLGAVLSQVQDGKERFIAAAGRKTTKYEANYGSTKGELAAVVFALRKFEHILRFKRFILFTDSGALKYLTTMKNPRGINFRWITELQSFDFEIQHKAGTANTNADALSRSEHMDLPTREEEEEEDEYLDRIRETLDERTATLPDEIATMTQVGAALSRENLILKQKEDPILNEVRKWVQSATKPTKDELRGAPEDLRAYAQRFELLTLDNDILYVTQPAPYSGAQMIHRMCLPEGLRESAFYWAHIHPSAGHFGIQSTTMRANSKFFYPGLTTDLKSKVGLCSTCLAKRTKHDPKQGTHYPSKNGFVGETLYVDLVGPLAETKEGKKYIMTCEDGFTRYVAAYPIPNKEASTCANVLINQYFPTFGIPVRIHSDNGAEFCNKIWSELTDRLQIKKTTTPVYNPASNVVERFHRSMNQMLRIFMERGEMDWARYIPACTLAYNTKVSQATGVTPYLALFGRECRLPLDLIIPSPESPHSLADHVRHAVTNFTAIYDYMRKNQDAIIRRNAKTYQGNQDTLKVGDRVWYLCPRKIPGKSPKFTDSWLGPYVIKARPAEVLVRIQPAHYEGPTITVHVSRVVPCTDEGIGKNRIPTKLHIDPAGDEAGEEIRPPSTGTDEGTPTQLAIPVQMPQPDHVIIDIIPKEKRATKKTGQTSNPPARSRPTSPAELEGYIRDEIDLPAVPIGETNTPEPEAPPVRDPPSNDPIPGPSKRERESETEENQRNIRVRTRKTNEQLRREWAKRKQEHPKRIAKKSKWLHDLVSDDSDEGLYAIAVDVRLGSDLPTQATRGSAGYDVRAARSTNVPSMGTARVPLNLRLAIPPNHFMLLISRSGLATKGITTQAGLIDSDFRGEVAAIIHNSTDRPFQIKKGQRISQGIFLPVTAVTFNEVADLEGDETVHTGFGSTGDGMDECLPHQIQ